MVRRRRRSGRGADHLGAGGGRSAAGQGRIVGEATREPVTGAFSMLERTDGGITDLPI
jgi:hypothetical protein